MVIYVYYVAKNIGNGQILPIRKADSPEMNKLDVHNNNNNDGDGDNNNNIRQPMDGP